MTTPSQVFEFFQSLDGGPPSTIQTALQAIKTYHAYFQFPPPPFDDPSVKLFIKGLFKGAVSARQHHISDHPRGGSIPFPPDLLVQYLQPWGLGASKGNLADTRSYVMALVQFLGALRISSLLAMCREHSSASPSWWHHLYHRKVQDWAL